MKQADSTGQSVISAANVGPPQARSADAVSKDAWSAATYRLVYSSLHPARGTARLQAASTRWITPQKLRLGITPDLHANTALTLIHELAKSNHQSRPGGFDHGVSLAKYQGYEVPDSMAFHV